MIEHSKRKPEENKKINDVDGFFSNFISDVALLLNEFALFISVTSALKIMPSLTLVSMMLSMP
ncbi:hypothetical protein CSC17_1864 [Klebsiella oxytoca]|nr:hypothetical protein CSC17_1864 [Klebsiella oxytoca]EKX5085492.1 hypothetical protein [Klebsiella oxytoca]EKX5097574.1 hypothetical protein [Klebsiella oxytoca]EKX5098351.1 hypothetical protein [Klebsiella oxytoca]EUC88252.1 hypothetical protein HMPREF1570_4084 [Klebsiella oxytoca KA-2]